MLTGFRLIVTGRAFPDQLIGLTSMRAKSRSGSDANSRDPLYSLLMSSPSQDRSMIVSRTTSSFQYPSTGKSDLGAPQCQFVKKISDATMTPEQVHDSLVQLLIKNPT